MTSESLWLNNLNLLWFRHWNKSGSHTQRRWKGYVISLLPSNFNVCAGRENICGGQILFYCKNPWTKCNVNVFFTDQQASTQKVSLAFTWSSETMLTPMYHRVSWVHLRRNTQRRLKYISKIYGKYTTAQIHFKDIWTCIFGCDLVRSLWRRQNKFQWEKLLH